VLQHARQVSVTDIIKSREVQTVKFRSLMLFLAVVLMAGCQTSNYAASAATDGTGITCSKIQQAFTAYQKDRQSAAAWTQLAQLISPAAGNYADMGVNTAAKYYDQIRATTDLALAVRGCQPVQ